MTALTAAASSTAPLLYTDTEAPNGSTWTLGDESIIVVGSRRPQPGDDRTIWLVERGYAGTAADAHDSGDTLTRYYPEAPATAGQGAAQTVSLLGPFAITVATPNFVDPVADQGLAVCSIPEGALFRPILEAVTGFDQAGSIQLVAGTDSATAYGIAAYDRVPNPPSGIGLSIELTPYAVDEDLGQTLNNLPRYARATGAGVSIFAAFYSIADAPTAGAVALYVLVAEPA